MIKAWSDGSLAPSAMLSGIATPEVLAKVQHDVMSGARAKWISLAGQRLQSTRRDYIAGLMEVDTVVIGKKVITYVALMGEWPNMIEEGYSAFQMHDTLLGPNVPVASGPGQRGKRQLANGQGYFRAVPFRHQTPGTIGQGGGPAMGSNYAGHPAVQNAEKLGLAVHGLAMKLAASKTSPGGKTSWGGRLPPGLAPKLKDKHSTDIYAGMTRHEKTYEGATQNTYFTFRTISDSRTDKWLHPGFDGVHLVDEVSQYVEKVAPMALKAVIG